MLIEFKEDPIQIRYQISAGPEEDIAFVGKNSYDSNIQMTMRMRKTREDMQHLRMLLN